jgi:hypothetical protein
LAVAGKVDGTSAGHAGRALDGFDDRAKFSDRGRIVVERHHHARQWKIEFCRPHTRVIAKRRHNSLPDGAVLPVLQTVDFDPHSAGSARAPPRRLPAYQLADELPGRRNVGDTFDEGGRPPQGHRRERHAATHDGCGRRAGQPDGPVDDACRGADRRPSHLQRQGR